jgi:hypothetical protein
MRLFFVIIAVPLFVAVLGFRHAMSLCSHFLNQIPSIVITGPYWGEKSVIEY